MSERTWKRKNFNCGTTSERMKGNDYNFNLCEACIIQENQNFSDKLEQRKRRFRFSFHQNLDFDGKGGARERLKFSPKAETETSGLCDDVVKL